MGSRSCAHRPGCEGEQRAEEKQVESQRGEQQRGEARWRCSHLVSSFLFASPLLSPSSSTSAYSLSPSLYLSLSSSSFLSRASPRPRHFSPSLPPLPASWPLPGPPAPPDTFPQAPPSLRRPGELASTRCAPRQVQVWALQHLRSALARIQHGSRARTG